MNLGQIFCTKTDWVSNPGPLYRIRENRNLFIAKKKLTWVRTWYPFNYIKDIILFHTKKTFHYVRAFLLQIFPQCPWSISLAISLATGRIVPLNQVYIVSRK